MMNRSIAINAANVLNPVTASVAPVGLASGMKTNPD